MPWENAPPPLGSLSQITTKKKKTFQKSSGNFTARSKLSRSEKTWWSFLNWGEITKSQTAPVQKSSFGCEFSVPFVPVGQCIEAASVSADSDGGLAGGSLAKASGTKKLLLPPNSKLKTKKPPGRKWSLGCRNFNGMMMTCFPGSNHSIWLKTNGFLHHSLSRRLRYDAEYDGDMRLISLRSILQFCPNLDFKVKLMHNEMIAW